LEDTFNINYSLDYSPPSKERLFSRENAHLKDYQIKRELLTVK